MAPFLSELQRLFSVCELKWLDLCINTKKHAVCVLVRGMMSSVQILSPVTVSHYLGLTRYATSVYLYNVSSASLPIRNARFIVLLMQFLVKS